MAYDSMPGASDGSLSHHQELFEAEEALARQNFVRARQLYAGLLEADPTSGAAAAGKAVTDVLLLPGGPEFTAMLVEGLGARSGVNANRLLYSRDGFLYWLSRGARWNDDGQFMGIRSLLSGELPWPTERLESLPAFVAGLDAPGDVLMSHLVRLADSLEQVEHTLQVAIDDPDFTWLFVPGEAFHDAQLNLVLGRSELSLLQSVVALGRAAIYFVSAYENTWTLEGGLGAWREAPEPHDERFVEGATAFDYSVYHFDGRLLRAIAHPERLDASREAFGSALRSLRAAIEYGFATSYPTTLQWHEADAQLGSKLVTLLTALDAALVGPVAVPFTSPATRADFSPLFEGRTLDADIPWMVRSGGAAEADDGGADSGGGAGADSDAAAQGWSVNTAALQRMFVDGLFEPPFSLDAQDGPSLEIEGDDVGALMSNVAGNYCEALEDAYFVMH